MQRFAEKEWLSGRSEKWQNCCAMWAYRSPQICINIHPDAVPPIHAESYHVAADKGPSKFIGGDSLIDMGQHVFTLHSLPLPSFFLPFFPSPPLPSLSTPSLPSLSP